MKYLPVVLLAMLPAFAQEAEQYRPCDGKATTQADMNKCATDEVARVDAQLNDVYRKLLAAAKDEEGAIGKIKAAELAWIKYRDSYMEAMYPAKNKQAEYGSMYPMDADLFRAKLTRRQVEALTDLLTHYGGEK